MIRICLRRTFGTQLLIPLLTSTLAVAAVTPSATANQLLGADEVIARVNSSAGAEARPKNGTAKDDAKQLLSDLESFKNVRAKLPVAEGVERWLKLYDRYRLLPPNPSLNAAFNPYSQLNLNELSLASLVAALPPPGSWELLKNRIVERQVADATVPDTVIRLVLFYITRDQARLDKGLADLKTSAALGGNRSTLFAMRDLHPDGLRAGAGKGGAITAESFEAYLQSLASERPKGRLTIQVPDLVALAGDKRANELLVKALAIPGINLNVPSGGATFKLAKQVVMQRRDTLTEPQWDLISSTDDVELYEAMDKRFPEKSAQQKDSADMFQKFDNSHVNSYADDPRQTARITYLLGLLSRNRVNDAIVLANRVEAENFQSKQFEKSWHSFDKLRFAAALNQFCVGVLGERPELQLWQQCGLIAANAGKAEALLTIIDAAAAKPGLSLEARMNVRDRKVDLLLAIDRSDEAVSLLRDALAYDSSKETPQVRSAMNRVKLRLAKRLCVLGRLLSRPELIDESEKAYIDALPGQGRGLAELAAGESGSMIEALIEAGRLAAAEQIVLASMQSLLQAPEVNGALGSRDLVLTSGLLAGQLVQLAEVYDRAGRHEDVMTLLEKSGWWGVTDLLDLTGHTKSLPTIVARTLYKSGRNGEALELVKWHLLGSPDDDAAYQLLIDLQGSAALPWLDSLYGRDRFEERPLIWKAVLLKRDGRLDEAEKSVRQALKIDPTDGEQSAGDRGRAYVVLGEILTAKGKGDDAAFFERVVKAVRIAETGDQMTQAGLLKKSLALYGQASDLFADAYCVQWRLAERLSSMGDLAGARKHYEIAFERMPEQFGQVARVCFGCEGVFTHQQSVTVAEEILTNFIKSPPEKPQVQYLLGQLRESQERKSEAYRHFSKAAALDPDYLDALKSAYSLRNDVFLGQAEMDALALRMLRLDPLLRHSGLVPGEISDVKGVWEVYVDQAANHEKPVKSLLPLTASKLEMEALVKKFGGNLDILEMKRSFFRDNRSVPEPGEAVVRNKFVTSLLQFAATSSMGGE